MGELLRDVHFAARQLARDTGLLETAVATLALCFGANTTIFGELRHHPF
jgi:hypothetical protein